MKKLLLLATVVASLAATGCRCGHFGGGGLGAFSPVQAMSPVVGGCSSGCTDACTSGCNEGGMSMGESYQGVPLTQGYGGPTYTQPEMIVPGPVIQ